MGGGLGGGLGVGGGAGLRSPPVGPEKVSATRSPTSPRGTSLHASHSRNASTKSRMRRRQPRLGKQHVVPPGSRTAPLLLGTVTVTGAKSAPVGTGWCSYALRFDRPERSESNVSSMSPASMLVGLINR